MRALDSRIVVGTPYTVTQSYCSTWTNEITLPVSFRNAEGPLDTFGGLLVGERYRAGPCG